MAFFFVPLRSKTLKNGLQREGERGGERERERERETERKCWVVERLGVWGR